MENCNELEKLREENAQLKEVRRFVLHLAKTGPQTLVIRRALDMYVRIGIGQFEAIADLARYGLLRNKDGQIPSAEEIEAAQEHLLAAKQLLTGLSATACFGIAGDHVNSEFKHAYNILQSKLRPYGG